MCDECCWCCGDSQEQPRSANPRKNVCCTDIIFLCIFLAFICGMIYVAAFSITQGDSLRLVYGYDSFGNTCNRDNSYNKIANVTFSGYNVISKRNVFFLDVHDPFHSMQLCVSECPDTDLNSPEEVQLFSRRTGSKLCRYDIDIDVYTQRNIEWSKTGPCPKLPILKSESVLSRCVPDLDDWIDQHEKLRVLKPFFRFINEDTPFRKILGDLYATWWEMLCLCGIALVLSFLMVILIRFFAAIMIWTIVVLAAVASVTGTVFLWWTYIQTKQNVNKSQLYNVPILDVDIQNEMAFLIFSIVASILTVILLLVIIVMRKRLSLVVALFHEAGRCIGAMPFLLLQPFITFIILLLFFACWVAVLAHISTAGSPEADYSKGFAGLNYRKQGLVSYFWWYHVIGLIWVSEFILACQQFVIAGSIANWYFSRQKSQLDYTICKSIARLILHHIGSVALGSFLIVIVKIPRYILMYIQAKFKDSENAVAKCCMKCCICCLWCLEKFLKFLNQNAYTIVAIRGMSFCPAAVEAFKVIANNVLRVAAINSVGDFVLFLGKVAIMAMTGATGVFWLKTYSNLHYFAVPVILVCTFAFLIGHCFLTVYEMVVDTLLLCFCEDCQMNDGTEGREYFMGESLKNMIKKSSAHLETLRKRPPRKDDQVDGDTSPEEKAMHVDPV